MARYKLFSLINMAGLSMGIAICFVLFLWVNDELSYDCFHENSDRIYRSLWEARYGDNSWKIPQVPMPLAGTLESEFPEVELATQAFEGRFTVKKGEEFVRENNVLFVDENFFDIFQIERIAGETKTAIANPDAILITRETAERYFGISENYDQVLGQTIFRNDGVSMIVKGVVKSFPVQSHLSFDFIGSLKNLKHLEYRKNQWGSATLLTYFLMDKMGDPQILSDKIQTYVDQNLVDEEFRQSGNYSSFPFESISDIHLKPNLPYIWIFGIIGAFILILACINFINLTTARVMNRAKEVGVRKVLGSNRTDIMKLFFMESMLYVFCSLIIALFLVQTFLPYFNDIANKQLTFNLTGSSFNWWSIGGIFIIASILTGTIPALVLSAFAPVDVIKGQFTKWSGKNRLREGLVVFQFCISSAIIIATLLVKDQLHFLQNKDLGFEKEHVLILRMANALQNNYHPFVEAIKQSPVVRNVSTSQFMPGDNFDSTVFVPEQPSNYTQTSLSYCHIDAEFVDALKLEIVAGRNFNPGLATDSTAYLINEKAAERLGWQNPVGKKLSYGGMVDGAVIGVVKNFNFSSLHNQIEPLVLRRAGYNPSNIFVRFQPGNLQEHLQYVKSEWKAKAPEAPFEYAFLDQEIQKLYENEQRMSTAFIVFAVLAIFIACLGLFGLASYTAEQRTREVGIRRVLGASVSGIVLLLSKDFLRLVILAFVIAGPLAYYFLGKWLHNFAYSIKIQVWVFLVTGIATLLIAFLTVSFQSLRAALVNPAQTLKDE